MLLGLVDSEPYTGRRVWSRVSPLSSRAGTTALAAVSEALVFGGSCVLHPLYLALWMEKLTLYKFGQGSVLFCPAHGSLRLAVGVCGFYCVQLYCVHYEFSGTLSPLA